ncbi:MAG: hypothetical protein J5I47_01410 [Vicingus serpentipes]|nr:hypothetical protein [Vicingus serpentipes]
MKKITRVFATLIALLIINNSANAQAFQKGNINIDVGIGFGAYSTITYFTTPAFTFGPITIPSQTISERDGAVSTMIPIIFEYGVSNKIGLGAEIGFVNYFIEDSTENDDGTVSLNQTESVKSVDFMVFCNFHLLDAEKNDLYIGLGFGGSSVNWEFKNTGETYSGSGGLFKLYLRDRIFFNDNVGLLLNLGYTSYVYNNMETSNANAALNSLKWNVKGINIGTGLALKF